MVTYQNIFDKIHLNGIQVDDTCQLDYIIVNTCI